MAAIKVSSATDSRRFCLISALLGAVLAITQSVPLHAEQAQLSPKPAVQLEQRMASAKTDCVELMKAVLPFAEKELGDHGEFFPYGGAMRPSGEIVSVAGYDGREQPPSVDLIRQIKGVFIESARTSKYKATALVYDVRVVAPDTGAKTDAIEVSLNHRDGYSVIVVFPYKLEGGKPVFGPVFAQKGEADIFPSL